MTKMISRALGNMLDKMILFSFYMVVAFILLSLPGAVTLVFTQNLLIIFGVYLMLAILSFVWFMYEIKNAAEMENF